MWWYVTYRDSKSSAQFNQSFETEAGAREWAAECSRRGYASIYVLAVTKVWHVLPMVDFREVRPLGPTLRADVADKL